MTPSYSTADADDADDDLTVEVGSPKSHTAASEATRQQLEKMNERIEKLTNEVQNIKKAVESMKGMRIEYLDKKSE
jgi:TolA-binding protein